MSWFWGKKEEKKDKFDEFKITLDTKNLPELKKIEGFKLPEKPPID
jgi:hypothetical protein